MWLSSTFAALLFLCSHVACVIFSIALFNIIMQYIENKYLQWLMGCPFHLYLHSDLYTCLLIFHTQNHSEDSMSDTHAYWFSGRQNFGIYLHFLL